MKLICETVRHFKEEQIAIAGIVVLSTASFREFYGWPLTVVSTSECAHVPSHAVYCKGTGCVIWYSNVHQKNAYMLTNLAVSEQQCMLKTNSRTLQRSKTPLYGQGWRHNQQHSPTVSYIWSLCFWIWLSELLRSKFECLAISNVMCQKPKRLWQNCHWSSGMRDSQTITVGEVISVFAVKL